MLRTTSSFRDTSATKSLCLLSLYLFRRSSECRLKLRALETGRFKSSATAASRSLEPTRTGGGGGGDDPQSSKNRSLMPTVMERIRNFPSGVKKLYSDMLRYKNIHDASRTRLNAWTIARNPLSGGNYSARRPFILDEELRPGRIPRREHEEQRRLKDDFRKVLPIVGVWAVVPFLGNIVLPFVVLTPRQTLSRQFFTQYQREMYAAVEFKQCQSHFYTLGECVFSSAMVSVKRLDISKLEEDAAGPVLDVMPFYVMFTEKIPEEEARNFILPVGELAHLNKYPREHLISLALANGLYQHLPDSLSSLAARFCPWLRQEVHRIGTYMSTDDTLLLEEAYDSNGCESMTDQEVMDACLMRGLPVTVPYDEMRVCLTNHLSMIRALKERVPYEERKASEGLVLLTMHLSAIRYYLHKEADLLS